MLDAFTCATFAAHIGETFALTVDTNTGMDLELIEATTLAEGGASSAATSRGRTPFSIIFRGPSTPILRQRIYSLEHNAMGRFDLFLVPIGPDERGMQYQAIFT